MGRSWGSEVEEDTCQTKQEMAGSQRTLRTFHLEAPEDSRGLDGTQKRSGRNWWISNTPDCGAILGLCHFSPNILIQRPFSSLTACLCALCFPCTNFFLLVRLAKLTPTSGPVYLLLCPLECLPSPTAHFHDWFTCSQVSVRHHFCLSRRKQPSAIHLVLASVFTKIILGFVGFFRIL